MADYFLAPLVHLSDARIRGGKESLNEGDVGHHNFEQDVLLTLLESLARLAENLTIGIENSGDMVPVFVRHVLGGE